MKKDKSQKGSRRPQKHRGKKPYIPWKPKTNLFEQLRRAQMSRATDLTDIETQIKQMEAEIQSIAVTYQGYHAEVTEAVKERLVAAGLWDEIHGMETEREEVRQRADAKINTLRGKITDLAKVREWMLAREQEDKKTSKKAPPSPPPDLDAPAPPPEAAAPEAPASEEAAPEAPPSEGTSEKSGEVIPMKTPRPRPVAPKV